MRNVHARGHEIGLHPSYATYLKPELIKREAQRLRAICFAENIDQKIYGGRMHYLRWSHPTTLQAWESAGMAYDSTLGYADHPGFRCGTCFEYHGFNPVTQQALELRLRPLVLMEDSLMSSDYLGLETGAAAIAKVDKLKSACKAFGGCFTLLWHNSSLSNSALRAFYQYSIKK